LILLSTYVI